MSEASQNGANLIRIIKSAPLPPPKAPRGSKSRYPLLDLEIGDSFVVPAENAGGVRTTAYQVAKRYGVKFSTRTLADGSVQVWRVRV